MNKSKGIRVIVIAGMLTGCTAQTPTIAHTHVGHAITGFDGTPGDQGLFVVAEKRANSAKLIADQLDIDGSPDTLKSEINRIVDETASSTYGLKKAITDASNHMVFAAKSLDASDNLIRTAATFSESIDAVVSRCDLIVLAANDVSGSTSAEEIRVLAAEIQALAVANVIGDDANGDGRIGSTPSEYGVRQLRDRLDALIGREEPAYQPVARWYLFHLVRLPNCDTCWAWRKWASSSNRGY